jgi:hypothetical protein
VLAQLSTPEKALRVHKLVELIWRAGAIVAAKADQLEAGNARLEIVRLVVAT